MGCCGGNNNDEQPIELKNQDDDGKPEGKYGIYIYI